MRVLLRMTAHVLSLSYRTEAHIGGMRADFRTRAGHGFMRAQSAYNSPRWHHGKEREASVSRI